MTPREFYKHLAAQEQAQRRLPSARRYRSALITGLAQARREQRYYKEEIEALTMRFKRWELEDCASLQEFAAMHGYDWQKIQVRLEAANNRVEKMDKRLQEINDEIAQLEVLACRSASSI